MITFKTHTMTLKVPHIDIKKRNRAIMHNILLKLLAYLSVFVIMTFILLMKNLTTEGFMLGSILAVPALTYLVLLGYVNGFYAPRKEKENVTIDPPKAEPCQVKDMSLAPIECMPDAPINYRNVTVGYLPANLGGFVD